MVGWVMDALIFGLLFLMIVSLLMIGDVRQ